ncbi:hypothetical protein [Azospirillum isscasi]|uniref:Uncharacterized protein n=1 Tax=Azospirillum isscasi TaxID=3053926 RepID=A0ABU0WDK2_9PROT|nr:hypothetical protein [Azospirillum isscasi]MDQ2102270.1 hypothetical protein [Azospirillum isscasi]
MIFETRHLVFTNSALKKAFGWYQKVPNQTDLPMGMIASVVPKSDGGVVVMVQQGAAKVRDVAFMPSKTLGVLLLFCRRQKIPIPRDAEKDIFPSDDGIMLTIRGSSSTTPPPP